MGAPARVAVHETVPLLRHVPSRTRQGLALEFADLMWEAQRAATEKNKARALLRAMAFPTCMLIVPPRQRHRDSPLQNVSNRNPVRLRLKAWEKVQAAKLWGTATQRARHARERANTAQPTSSHKNRLALRLAQEGTYNKAIRVLQLAGLHALTPEVIQILRDNTPSKHSPRTVPSPSPLQEQRDPSDARTLHFGRTNPRSPEIPKRDEWRRLWPDASTPPRTFTSPTHRRSGWAQSGNMRHNEYAREGRRPKVLSAMDRRRAADATL